MRRLLLTTIGIVLIPVTLANDSLENFYYWIDSLNGIPQLSSHPPTCHIVRSFYPQDQPCPHVFIYDGSGGFTEDTTYTESDGAAIIAEIQQRREQTLMAREQKEVKRQREQQQAQYETLIAQNKVGLSMTPDQVTRAWGKPESIKTVISDQEIHEIWYYPDNQWVQFANGTVDGFEEKTPEN